MRPRLLSPLLAAGLLAATSCAGPSDADPNTEPTPVETAGAGLDDLSQFPEGATAAAPPDWVRENWTALVGTWIADNAPHRSDAEPFDAYGIEWSWGIGERSLVGRLYGLQDGREVGPFWEFREYWHPGDAVVIATQFGADGTVGIGPHLRLDDGRTEIRQAFFYPDTNTVTRVGHRSRLSGDEHVTQSFDVDADGNWTPRRSYVWKRQPR